MMERRGWMSDAGYLSGVRAELLAEEQAPFSRSQIARLVLEVLAGAAIVFLVLGALVGIGYVASPHAAALLPQSIFSDGLYPRPITLPEYAVFGMLALLALFIVAAVAFVAVGFLRGLGHATIDWVRSQCGEEEPPEDGKAADANGDLRR